MLLIDYFAARVMQSLCAQYDFSEASENDFKRAAESPFVDKLAEFSYTAAIAMLYAKHKVLHKDDDEAVNEEEQC